MKAKKGATHVLLLMIPLMVLAVAIAVVPLAWRIVREQPVGTAASAVAIDFSSFEDVELDRIAA